MKKIYFATGNDYKLRVAQKALSPFGIEVDKVVVDVPEIQSDNVEEIIGHSIQYVFDKINKPVFLTDAGVYIEALKGFPGPFIKYINKWLSPEKLLKLLEGENNRSIYFEECLAYCEPKKKPVIFVSRVYGKIADKVSNAEGTSIERVFIPEGHNKIIAELSKEEATAVWNTDGLKKLGEYLKKKTIR